MALDTTRLKSSVSGNVETSAPRGMRTLEWMDTRALSERPEIDSRNRIARAWSDIHPETVVQKYAHLTLAEFRALLDYVLSEVGVKLCGTGVELGVGVGGVSNSLLSLYPEIRQIYGIEIVPEVVKTLLTNLTRYAGNQDRLIAVIGSFDDIQLPDGSVDFIVELDALHHSENLCKTLTEAARILKPGGVLIAFDRMNPDSLSDRQREFMLNVEYGEDMKREYGLPLDRRLTRGENGEHEIRESEWRNAFTLSGLSLEQCITFHKKCLRGFAFGIISQIPWSLRNRNRFYPMLVRFPLQFFLFYALPFMPALWRNKYRSVGMSFTKRGAFLSRTVFVARKAKS